MTTAFIHGIPGINRSQYESESPTLRDWLAIMALQAIYEHHTKLTDLAAKLAYEQADEMLKARDDRS